ncbi:MAG: M23 family metallopeptidase [bacterium]
MRKLTALTLILASTVSLGKEGVVQLKGEFEQGALLVGKTLPGSQVTHDAESVMVSAAGDFLIGFEREAPLSSTLTVVLPDGKSHQQTLSISRKQYNIQRIDGLPERKVTPKPADSERIKADRAAVKKARSRRDSRTDYLAGFEWPATGKITGVYGSQRVLNGKPKWPHFGVDVAGPVGTPVTAPAPGIVTLVHPDMFYSGGTLIVDHGQGLSSTFIHLHKIHVKEGDRVEQGMLIAEIGATGRATGPHLDWRINLGSKRLDPETVVGEMPTGKEQQQ